MITIIAGSRTFTNTEAFDKGMSEVPWDITEVVSGRAQGADMLGESYAEEYGLPCHHFPAEWKKYGKKAGFIRNVAMAEFAEALVVFWDGQSPGTRNMIRIAEQKGLPVFIWEAEYPGRNGSDY